MSTTDVTTWGHAAIRFERDGRRLVIDPGMWSDPAALDGADAVLITHEHPDHVVPERLAAALTARPGLSAWGPEPVVRQLVDAGAPRERVHEATGGQEFTAAGFAVRALGRDHATVHPSLPSVANVAYLIDGAALHPGDSFTTAPDGIAVHVLFLPIAAPWLKAAEAAEYLRAVHPAVAVPIHDAVLSDAGRTLTDRVLTTLAGDSQYRRLKPGDALTVPGAA